MASCFAPQSDATIGTEERRSGVAGIGRLAVLFGRARDMFEGAVGDDQAGAVGASADLAAIAAVADRLARFSDRVEREQLVLSCPELRLATE